MTRPSGRAGAAVLLALALTTALAGCGGGADGDGGPGGTPSVVDHPDALVAHLDQNRILRLGRTVSVGLAHEPEGTVTVTRAEVASDRYEPVVWTGEETFEHQVQLDVELPPQTRCGAGSDATVTLTYRLGEGPWVRSTTTATDLYGSVGQLLDRDCAAQTFAEAATLEVGEHRVVGAGPRSRFLLPVRIAATGERPEVSFAGFASTVLFAVDRSAGLFPDTDPLALTTGTVRDVVLSITPARCDPHALAEDKVGTLFPVHLTAPGLPDDAAFHLPISDAARGDLRAFFAPHCGI